ncbi:hypothetical protein [Mumia sp. Pv 4-285]|uniref:hypothetical protein n=1 Tax=Mumia qirimensis TaxID=3234852 RepID=UPI00351D3CE8
MIRHDPVAHDDVLVDDLLAGNVPDDPIFAGLAAWRTSLAEMEAPRPPAFDVTEVQSSSLFDRPIASSCKPSRRVRPPKRGSRTGRAAVVVVGAGLLLSMGIGQAVAGSPVAPLRYVVTRAVGIGDDVASPTASDVPRSQVPSSSPDPAVTTGRSGAGAVPPTETEDKAAPSAGSSESKGRGEAPASGAEPDPAPDTGKGPVADDDEPTTKPPEKPHKPRQPEASPAPPTKPPRTDAPPRTPVPTTPPTTKPPKGGYDWWDRDDDDEAGGKPKPGRPGRPHERPGAKDGEDSESDGKDSGTGKDTDRGTGTDPTTPPVPEDSDETADGGTRDRSYDWIWKLLNAVD